MKLFLLTIMSVCGILSAGAADSIAGKQKALSCAGCHGVNGLSNNPEWPNLAGQKAKYLEKQIIAFRDGKREDPMMSQIVKGFSNDDAANIAAYFSNLKN